MNKAILLKEQLPQLYRNMSEAKEKFTSAEFKLHKVQKEIETTCTHKNEEGKSALLFNSSSMYREWGTCQICGKYMET